MLKWIALNYNVMLKSIFYIFFNRENSINWYQYWSSVIKKPLNKYTVYMLFVHSFEDWIWIYCNIKLYFKTLMLGGINHD